MRDDSAEGMLPQDMMTALAAQVLQELQPRCPGSVWTCLTPPLALSATLLPHSLCLLRPSLPLQRPPPPCSSSVRTETAGEASSVMCESDECEYTATFVWRRACHRRELAKGGA